ncbi:MAG: hypothetical protein FJ146_13470 [Deltaproteobacteria bacterium]|nr:hypothetical protein [Deltaproteobacteria bacterium]
MSSHLHVAVSVPGKIMLAGEYSAIGGAPATAATLDRVLTAEATELEAPTIDGCRVSSDIWATTQLVPDGSAPADYPDEPLLATVAGAMQLYGVSNIELKVSSELPVAYGIGSSSALRLAVLAAFGDIARQKQQLAPLAEDELGAVARTALQLQRTAQQQASGYDIATQWMGGIVVSQTSADINTWPLALQRLGEGATVRLANFTHVLVGGRGAPTGSAIGTTSRWLRDGGKGEARSDQLDQINTAINEALWAMLGADSALDLHQLTCFKDLVTATRNHRRLFAGAPGFPSALFAQASQVLGWEERWAMKTTGAGGEDAVLIFGSSDDAAKVAAAVAPLGWHLLPSSFGAQGLRIMRTNMREET